MVKTRSQALHSGIKKEECEDKSELRKVRRVTNNATKNKKVKAKVDIQARNVNVRSRQVKDIEPTLKGREVTNEQVAQAIHYIVRDKMSITAASRKAGISALTAKRYYEEYKRDPENKIPLAKIRLNNELCRVTQKKIEDLIHYIVHDKMNVTQASYEVKINRSTAAKYYAKYKEDPGHKMPTLVTCKPSSHKCCTQDQINRLIGYIVDNKMTVAAASKKAHVCRDTAKRYYAKYLVDPNHKVPVLRGQIKNCGKRCADEKINALIGYIANDGWTLRDAAAKAGVSETCARKYYRKYLEDPTRKLSTLNVNEKHGSNRHITLEQSKNFFSYIIIDKLNVVQAAKKANMSKGTGYAYYKKYLENTTQKINGAGSCYSVEKMEKMVEYIQKDDMSITAAANKANLNHKSAFKLYRQYLKDPKYTYPKLLRKQYTHEDVKRLIGYIEHDKMSVQSSARKIGMGKGTAFRYYTDYKNDPERKIPVPMPVGQRRRLKSFDRHSQIVADIYKNNTSIEPIKKDLNLPTIEIKQEYLETKDELKYFV